MMYNVIYLSCVNTYCRNLRTKYSKILKRDGLFSVRKVISKVYKGHIWKDFRIWTIGVQSKVFFCKGVAVQRLFLLLPMKFIVQSWYEVCNMWVKIVDNCFGETLYVRFKYWNHSVYDSNLLHIYLECDRNSLNVSFHCCRSVCIDQLILLDHVPSGSFAGTVPQA